MTSVGSDENGVQGSDIQTWAQSATQVKNVHNDTWGYSEEDPQVTEYVNELTGQPYFKDAQKQGIPTISFTMGEYSFTDKAALQGGKGDSKKWERSAKAVIIEKAVLAQTKSGNWIFFPKANILAKGNFVEKNIGLGVSAVPLETGVKGLTSEAWFNEDQITIE